MIGMSRKLEIIVRIKDESGEAIVEKSSEKDIPYIEEFDKQGFRTSFDQLERAILTGRKEVSEGIVTEYMADISKKKQSRSAKKRSVE